MLVLTPFKTKVLFTRAQAFESAKAVLFKTNILPKTLNILLNIMYGFLINFNCDCDGGSCCPNFDTFKIIKL